MHRLGEDNLSPAHKCMEKRSDGARYLQIIDLPTTSVRKSVRKSCHYSPVFKGEGFNFLAHAASSQQRASLQSAAMILAVSHLPRTLWTFQLQSVHREDVGEVDGTENGTYRPYQSLLHRFSLFFSSEVRPSPAQLELL